MLEFWRYMLWTLVPFGIIAATAASQSLFTTPTLNLVGSIPGGGPVAGVVHGDFTSDGILDALVGSGAAHQVQVLPGTAGGGIGAAIVTVFPPNGNLPQGPVPIVAWDVNQDGHLDAVCSMSSGMRVIYGTGSGSFNPVLNPPTTPPPWATSIYDVAGADLDNDGVLEFVIVGDNAPVNPTGRIANIYTVLPGGFLFQTYSYAPAFQYIGVS